MTRSKERLYIFCKSFPDKIENNFDTKGKLHSFLHNFSKSYPIIEGDDKENHQYKTQEKYHSYLIKNQDKSNWRNMISLKHSTEKVWDLEKQKKSVEWGKILHLARSRIKKKKDIKVVIERLLAKGKCDISQYKKLKKQLPILLQSEQISKYFTTNWEVRAEKEILIETGESYIPDRLVFNGKEVTIIDYKTGDKKTEHQKQIQNYANALKNMGYKVAETDLIYTKDILKE